MAESSDSPRQFQQEIGSLPAVHSQPRPGQRWLSNAEPELGLGIILEVDTNRLTLFFPAVSENRVYALRHAPLRRIVFKPGDRVLLQGGGEVVVTEVKEENGLLFYEAGGQHFPESELSDTMDLSTPYDRLVAGRTDAIASFALRTETLQWRQAIRSSAVRGLAGARIEMIPHQIFIASEVASRLRPRVLLADEVGLGKTIEAGLILHRLHLTGRAARVLILVPEPLIHQWFVEMLRRFNLLFALFDEARCAAIEAGDPDGNPFHDSQLILASVTLLEAKPARARQAEAGEWDLVIVDEAHHLEWSETEPSAAYQIVEAIAKRTPGLLLLTATPQQLGMEGHFARLRLIDPDRYDSLPAFREEAELYARVAAAVERVLAGKSLSAPDRQLFAERSPRVRKAAEALANGSEAARESLVEALIDDYGIGRSLFRNRRANMRGFPKRKFVGEELPAGEPTEQRLIWLAALLRRLKQAKVLLICRSQSLAEALHEALPHYVQVKSALFHEGLTLINRDRNAAYFAEEDGARLLICSEIGSEGRNFQFAHHLVLFDLPENPDLLEQRIGRLDRIGQSAMIRIHVPVQEGSYETVLARWYHEGLNAFEKTAQGAGELAEEMLGKLRTAFAEGDAERVEQLIAETQQRHQVIEAKLAKGNDRLLALHSCRPERARDFIKQVCAWDEDRDFEAFVIRLFDDAGLHLEELAPRKWLIRTGHLRSDAFPALPEEGMSATFDRATATSRDDLAFMTMDHPTVRGAIDLLLGSEIGNATFALWPSQEPKALFLEVISVVECVAPAVLHADRFLAPEPIRVLVDHRGGDRSAIDLRDARLVAGDLPGLLDKPGVRQEMLPTMRQAAEALIAVRTGEVVARAVARMDDQLQAELDRLHDLRAMNHPIPPEEIAELETGREALRRAIEGARPRVEAMRLILRKLPG